MPVACFHVLHFNVFCILSTLVTLHNLFTFVCLFMLEYCDYLKILTQQKDIPGHLSVRQRYVGSCVSRQSNETFGCPDNSN